MLGGHSVGLPRTQPAKLAGTAPTPLPNPDTEPSRLIVPASFGRKSVFSLFFLRLAASLIAFFVYPSISLLATSSTAVREGKVRWRVNWILWPLESSREMCGSPTRWFQVIHGVI